MSLVVFPFKEENFEVVAANLTTAATHDRVHEVWAVGASDNITTDRVSELSVEISAAHSMPIAVFAQDRLGTYRSGKGDGMNTAIRNAAERGFDRIHFYDADITNFDHGWIDGAENAADRGFGVVRHRFPRAATDAMITWMVTRPGLATLFPGSILPRLGQPLGGELLLNARAVESLASDAAVVARSDWGIDTMITHRTAALGLDIYEHNAPDGKRHALYGSLTDIRDMILECLDAVSSLAGRARPSSIFEADPPADVPDDLKEVVGYDTQSTRASIADGPSAEESAVLAGLGVDGSTDLNGDEWLVILPRLLRDFDLGSPAWRAAAFRLWVRRVLHYTEHVVPSGYDQSMNYLESTILSFEAQADEHDRL